MKLVTHDGPKVKMCKTYVCVWQCIAMVTHKELLRADEWITSSDMSSLVLHVVSSLSLNLTFLQEFACPDEEGNWHTAKSGRWKQKTECRMWESIGRKERVSAENERLAAENEMLKAVAVKVPRLEEENRKLKGEADWVPWLEAETNIISFMKVP